MALNPAMMALIKGAKAKHTRGGNNKTVKLKEGKTQVRILPSPLGEESPFWQDLGVHWIKAEKNGKPLAVVGCHDHTYDTPCPVCAAIDKAAKATSDDESLALVKDWKGKKSVLVNALIRKFNGGASESGNEPVILEMTSTTFGAMCGIIEEYAEEYGNVLDLKTGMDFVITRSGKGLDTEYTVMPAPKNEPVPKGVMEKVTDLAEFVKNEYFEASKETKGLNAIASVTGVTPTVSTVTRTMLTGPSRPTIIDADVEEIPAPRRKPAPAPVAEVDDVPFDAEEEVVVRKPAAKPAAAAPKKAVVVESELPEDEIDSLLADLDSM